MTIWIPAEVSRSYSTIADIEKTLNLDGLAVKLDEQELYEDLPRSYYKFPNITHKEDLIEALDIWSNADEASISQSRMNPYYEHQ